MKTIFITADNDRQFRHLCANFNLNEDSNQLIRVRRLRDVRKFNIDPENTVVMAPAYRDGDRIVFGGEKMKKRGRPSIKDNTDFYDPFEQYDGVEAASAVKEMIDFNYMSGNTAKDYAAMVNLSLTYMCRVFRRENRISIGEYIAKVRMEKAAEMLRSSNCLIKDVARLVGYPNFSYFCKRFKEFYQMTPAEYRRASRIKKKEGETIKNGTTTGN